jgi:hypothetical protein
MTLSTPPLRFSVSLAIKTARNPRIQGAMPLGVRLPAFSAVCTLVIFPNVDEVTFVEVGV